MMYFETFAKAFDFSGRSARKEYWLFVLGSILLTLPMVLIDAVLGMYNPDVGMGPVTAVALLIVVVPCFALTVRRLHDIDYSGWWFFIGFVPFVGGIIQLVLALLPGTEGDNRYGANPKDAVSS